MGSHAASLKTVTDMILAEKDIATALKGVADDAAPAAPSSSAVVPGPTPNFDRSHDFEEKPLEDFKASHTLFESSSQ